MTKFRPMRNIMSYDVTYKVLATAFPTSVLPLGVKKGLAKSHSIAGKQVGKASHSPLCTLGSDREIGFVT